LITSSGPVVVSAGQDGKMIIWDVEEKEEHTLESALVVEYPARELIELIEPAAEVRISEEPLQTVAMNGPNLFVLDMQGTLNMWS
jgi:hypothetical protein